MTKQIMIISFVVSVSAINKIKKTYKASKQTRTVILSEKLLKHRVGCNNPLEVVAQRAAAAGRRATEYTSHRRTMRQLLRDDMVVVIRVLL
jgi:hypothetical protein